MIPENKIEQFLNSYDTRVGYSIFNETVDGEATPDAHTFLPVDEQCVHFLLQIALQIRFDLQQLLMLCFGFLQFSMQHRDRVLDIIHLLDEVHVGQISAKTKSKMNESPETAFIRHDTHLHCSTPARCPRASNRVWATFSGSDFSWMARRSKSMFRSMSNIS